MAKVELKLKLTNNSYYDINRFNGLKSVESLSQSTTDGGMITNGVIANSGNMQAVDIDGTIANMIKNGQIRNSNIDAKLLCNNSQIQDFIINDSNYDVVNKVYSVQMTNKLSNWDNINVEETKFAYQIVNLENILRTLLDKYTNYSYSDVTNMLNTSMVYGNNVISVQTYLSNITVESWKPYLNQTTLREAVNRICDIAQLSCYINDDGDIKFVSNRPRLTGLETIIEIPKKYQFSSIDYNLIYKNKYNNVKYTNIDSLGNLEETLNQEFELEFSTDGHPTEPASWIIDLSKFAVDNAQVVNVSGTPYLRFYKTVSNNGTFARYDINYPNGINAFEYDFTGHGSSSSSANSTIYSVNETKDTYQFTYNGIVRLTPYSKLNSETFAFNLELPTGFAVEQLKMIIRGNVYNITNNDIIYNSNDDIFELSNSANTLFTSDVKYLSNNKMYDIVCANIIADYSEGLNVVSLTVSIGDYYDTYGNRVLTSDNGDIFKVGDIIKIDIDNNHNSAFVNNDDSIKVFKIASSKFYYSGTPMLDLQLQEIKTPVHVVTFSDDGVMFDKQFVIEDNYAQTPNTLPQKEGYVITGWKFRTGSATTIISSLNSFSITQNYNFEPVWTQA